MAIDLAVNDAAAAHRASVNMAIVIDHSGSMSGDKIAQARQAAHGIVERLGAEDRVALIQYDDDAQVLVPAIAADAEGKQRLFAAIERIADQGVRVTTIGLGLDYNEDLMEATAENGRGQYYYVKDAGSLESVFAGELRS